MINSELRTYCERLAKIEIQRKELADEAATLKKEAGDKGYDKALITKTVALMTKPAVRQRQLLDQLNMFDLYLSAVGLIPAFEPQETQAIDTETHDPETGEITDSPAPVAARAGEVAADGDTNPVATPIEETSPVCEIEAGLMSETPQRDSPPAGVAASAVEVPPGASTATNSDPGIHGEVLPPGGHGHPPANDFETGEPASPPASDAGTFSGYSSDAVHPLSDDGLDPPPFLDRRKRPVTIEVGLRGLVAVDLLGAG